MEDFNSKFLENNNKNNGRYFAIVITLLVFILLLIYIINTSRKKSINNDLSKAIILIEAENKDISRRPENTGGLNVENLDVDVYNVLDKNNDDNELKINDVPQKIENDLIVSNNESLNDTELLMDKIEEIGENKNIELLPDNQEINLKINSEKKEDINNFDNLKSLGNDSLIKNIKEKKYIKPAVKVQLLAVKNKKTIENYWENLKENYGKLFSDKSYFIEKNDLSSDNSIYRLQIGMFPDEVSANNFCQEYIKIANKNKIDCIVVK